MSATCAICKRPKWSGGHTLNMNECSSDLSCPLAAHQQRLIADLIYERDSLRAALAACEKDRDEARALAAPNGCALGGVLMERVEHDTAKAIADFVGTCMDTEAPGDWRLIPRRIRANDWKRKL